MASFSQLEKTGTGLRSRKMNYLNLLLKVSI